MTKREGGGGRKYPLKGIFSPPLAAAIYLSPPIFSSAPNRHIGWPFPETSVTQTKPPFPVNPAKPNLPNPTRGPKQWVSSFPLSHDP